MSEHKQYILCPQRTADGNILVDCYTTDDPENPQNWSNSKRAFVSIIICTYTFVVYTGSAIYTSSIEGVMRKFGFNHVEAALPLSLYVLAYGIGPLLSASLSEIPLSAAPQCTHTRWQSLLLSPCQQLWSTTSLACSSSASDKDFFWLPVPG